MQTLITIISPISQYGEIADTKDQIVKYLGARMIEANPQEMPIMIINCGLENVDKTAIMNIVRNMDDRCIILFIESEEEIPDNAFFNLSL